MKKQPFTILLVICVLLSNIFSKECDCFPCSSENVNYSSCQEIVKTPDNSTCCTSCLSYKDAHNNSDKRIVEIPSKDNKDKNDNCKCDFLCFSFIEKHSANANVYVRFLKSLTLTHDLLLPIRVCLKIYQDDFFFSYPEESLNTNLPMGIFSILLRV